MVRAGGANNAQAAGGAGPREGAAPGASTFRNQVHPVRSGYLC